MEKEKERTIKINEDHAIAAKIISAKRRMSIKAYVEELIEKDQEAKHDEKRRSRNTQ